MNYLNNLLYLLCVAAGLNLPTITTAQNRTNSNQEIKIGVYENDINYDNFKVPAKQYMGHAWFTFRLSGLTDEAVKGMVQRAVESNAYGGYMITPDRGRMPLGSDTNTKPNATYLDDEFFRLYKLAIEEGLKHG